MELKVINTIEDLELVTEHVAQMRSYAIPIWSDRVIHLAINTLSVLFIICDNMIYCIPMNHVESINQITLEDIQRIQPKEMFTYNKKDLLYVLPNANIIDVAGIEYMLSNQVTEISHYYGRIIRDFYLKFREYKNTTTCIPLMNLIEFAEELYSKMTTLTAVYRPWKFLDETIIPTCFALEKDGMKIDEEIYLKYFGKTAKKNIKDGYVYSSYYPYLITGRCSNAFGGVNYAALNSSNGCRKAFISRYPKGKLILIDYESFHLRLIADIIGFEQPTEPFHQYLAKQYFGKDEITPEEYAQSKIMTFHNLYNDVRKEDMPEFFHKLWHWLDNVWEEATANGYHYTEFGRKISMQNIIQPTKAKLFNYIVQSKESEISLKAIHNILPLFVKNSKPVLYTFDSLLVDYGEDPELLDSYIDILKLGFGGTYPTRVYTGNNFHKMESYQPKVGDSKE